MQLPADWFVSILTNPVTERAFYLIVVVLLIGLLDRRLCAMIGELAKLGANMKASQTALISQSAHQASRMTEIRNFMRDLLREGRQPPAQRE